MATVHVVRFLPVLLTICVIILVQFSSFGIIGADGHLHGRLSLMMAQSGFIQDFPAAYFSWFNERFADKDFAYHLYLIPFTSLFGYISGVKLGALLATSLLIWVTIFLLSQYSKNPWVSWFGLTLILSSQFLRDTAEARPFVFGIVFTLLSIHALILGKVRWVFILSFVYGLVHMSAWIVPLLAVVFFVENWISGTKTNYKLLLFALLGWLCSFMVHPNFPTNIFYFYLNGILVPYYAAIGGVLELGAEFFPLSMREFFLAFPITAGSLLIWFWFSFVHASPMPRAGRLWGSAFLVIFVLGFVAKRNLTHMYPIGIIFFGIAFSHLFNFLTKTKQNYDKQLAMFGAVGTLVLLFSIWMTSVQMSLSLVSEKVIHQHFTWAAETLKKHENSGRVFHANWSDSQYLIGLTPEFEYLVTLDPIYMYTLYPDLYRKYRTISFGATPDPYNEILEEFGATMGYAGKNYFSSFIAQIKSDPRFIILGEDDLGIVFALTPSTSRQ